MTTKNEHIADLKLGLLLLEANRSAVHTNAAGRISKQKFTVSRYCTIDGERVHVRASVRFDDECRNGHETFAITGEVREVRKDFTTGLEYTPSGDRYMISGGCVHEQIAAAFPELGPFIKWHLTSTDGPMHYAANVIYLAGDKDHNGLRAGEPRIYREGLRFPNGLFYSVESSSLLNHLRDLIERREPLGDAIELPARDEGSAPGSRLWAGGATFDGFNNPSSIPPFKTYQEAHGFHEAFNTCLGSVRFERIPYSFSKGKPRELDAARRSAVWLDASDEDLTAPGLAERLAERLPALMAEFKADMLALGFTWPEVKTEEAAGISAA